MPCIQNSISRWQIWEWELVVNFLGSWVYIMPVHILENILGQLIFPQLQKEVENWNPLTDIMPIHHGYTYGCNSCRPSCSYSISPFVASTLVEVASQRPLCPAHPQSLERYVCSWLLQNGYGQVHSVQAVHISGRDGHQLLPTAHVCPLLGNGLRRDGLSLPGWGYLKKHFCLE